jgi:hypothetical protein
MNSAEKEPEDLNFLKLSPEERLRALANISSLNSVDVTDEKPKSSNESHRTIESILVSTVNLLSQDQAFIPVYNVALQILDAVRKSKPLDCILDHNSNDEVCEGLFEPLESSVTLEEAIEYLIRSTQTRIAVGVASVLRALKAGGSINTVVE